ncbi:MAG: recombinase family protein [Proteobacteria bacterium]|nr:MAG: recombinase family protein [Pseudomonadota bacterium]
MPKNLSEKQPSQNTSIATDSSFPLYLIYTRVSIDDDTTGSHTFETQDKRTYEFLDRKHGEGQYRVAKFKDDGYSGSLGFRPSAKSKKIRPGLAALTKRVSEGGCAGVVVYSLSRLFRDLHGMLDLIDEVLLPANIDLFSATEEFDINDADV